MGDAVRAHHGQQRIKPASAERSNLFKRPGLDHFVETRIYPSEELGPRGRDEKAGAGDGIQQRRGPSALKLGEGPSGGRENFQRAQYPLRVAWPKPASGERINPRELRVKLSRRESPRVLAHPRAHLRWHGGNVGEALQCSLEIKAGAARDHGEPPPRRQVIERRLKILQPPTDRIIFRAVDMTKQPVRNRLLFLKGRARGQESLGRDRPASSRR